MKKRNFFFSAAPILGAVVLACGLAVGAATPRKAEVKPVHAQAAAEQADLTRFRLRDGSAGSVSVANNKLNYNGAWDSNFCVTDQFNTLSKSYSLKAHVQAPTWTNHGDDYFGMTIYYESITYITFYLKWNGDAACANTVAEGVWLCHVNGGHDQVYASAKQNGAWETRGTFTDVWTDWSGWSETLDGANVNLRDNSKILLNEGFDFTFHVERETYLGRLADKIYLEIGATAADGVTPKTFYSPSYRVDAATNPLGAGESHFAYMNPQIGYASNQTGIEITDVEFTDKAATTHNAKFETIGNVAVADVRANLDTNSLAYTSSALFGDYAFTFDLPTASDETFVFSADVSGTAGDIADSGVGFFYWLDGSNYLMTFLKWYGTLDAPGQIITVSVVNGNDGSQTASCQAARDPWDAYADKGFWGDYWNDGGGFATDASYVCGGDDNINHMRSETGTVTLQAGFNLALIRARRTYAGRLADVFQIRITGNGKDGKVHNWYSPLYAIDGFTYPMGGAASAAIDKAPAIGFLHYNVGTVQYSNIKFNGGEVRVDLTDRQYVRNFGKDALEMNTIPTTDHSDTGHCKDVWTSVKTAYNALTADQKTLLMTDAEFADAKARLEAWAAANGETINSTTYVISLNPNNKSFYDNNTNNRNGAVIAISVIAALSLISIAALVILKKRTHK